MYRLPGYGFCLSEFGTGSTNQSFGLEQGTRSAHSDSETRSGLGLLYSARIALQTNTVAVPARVPLHFYANSPFPIRKLRLTFWNKMCTCVHLVFSTFCLEQGYRSKIASLYKLEEGRVPRHSPSNPHPKLKEFLPRTTDSNFRAANALLVCLLLRVSGHATGSSTRSWTL